MSRSYSLGFVSVVICLPVILLSSVSDAQSTVDEPASCSSSMSDDVTRELREIKAFLSSNQKDNAKEFQEVKNRLRQHPFDAAETSKQALVSALICKYLVQFIVPLFSIHVDSGLIRQQLRF